jgi:serine/threonine-protein kinase SRPK3
LTQEELFEVIGAPESEGLTRQDGMPLDKGVPRQLVRAAGWNTWAEEDEEDLRIFDLGETFLKGAEPEKLAQPPHLKAPETIFMDSFDSRHDLWRAGIMVRTPRLKFLEKDTVSLVQPYAHGNPDWSDHTSQLV